MGERIRELAVEAGIVKDIVIKEAGVYLRNSLAIERFAELIVRDAIKVADRLQAYEVMDALFEHFDIPDTQG
jgi:hypothetical protein